MVITELVVALLTCRCRLSQSISNNKCINQIPLCECLCFLESCTAGKIYWQSCCELSFLGQAAKKSIQRPFPRSKDIMRCTVGVQDFQWVSFVYKKLAISKSGSRASVCRIRESEGFIATYYFCRFHIYVSLDIAHS